jgi:hypothetical protein
MQRAAVEVDSMKSLLSVFTLFAMLALPVAAQRGQCDGTGPHGKGRGQGQGCAKCEKCDRQGGQRGMRGGMRGGMGGLRQNQNPPAVPEKK